MATLAKNYIKWIEDESKNTKEQLAIRNVGKIDPQRHLLSNIEDSMATNIVDVLGTSINQRAF